jgi:anthranilate synthase component 2
MNILLLDHEDSFTRNIEQSLLLWGAKVLILPYDHPQIGHDLFNRMDALVLGPGPGHPAERHRSFNLLSHYQTQLPILGICLGHQIIGAFFGSKIKPCPQPSHGKQASLSHDLSGIPQKIGVGRYHSWMIDLASLPDCLQMRGSIEDLGVTIPMIIQHRELPIMGMQFHPESVLTEQNEKFFEAFLAQS